MKILGLLKGDRVLWVVIFLLSVISLLAVYSSSQSLALGSRNTFFFLFKQVVYLMIGLAAVFFTHRVNYRKFLRLSQFFLVIIIPVLLFTMISGRDVNSARRWVEVPVIGLSVQPSDFAKIILITYVARVLSLKQESLGKLKEFYLPLLGIIGIVCVMILPQNFSTAALLFSTCMVLMFIGRVPLKYIFLTLAAGILLFFIVIKVMDVLDIKGRQGTWANRIENFKNSDDESVNNFQVNRAKVAIVNGGIIGKGPGNSLQKQKLPQANSDFIYAVIIEEYGLIGGIIVMFLYLYILFRAAIMARRSTRTFSALTAVGLSMIIVFQALINMAVAVNLVPVTGQPLPIISSGGSSVLATSIALGIILSISWGIKEERQKLNDQLAGNES